MKRHVKVMGEKLATLTVEHELEMRKIVVALESTGRYSSPLSR